MLLYLVSALEAVTVDSGCGDATQCRTHAFLSVIIVLQFQSTAVEQMPPFAPSSLLTNVHSGNAVRCLATHSPPGCDGLMMTTAAALQAPLPFVCSAIEVINAIIRYAGRAHVCTSYRRTGTVVITEEASWDVKMLRVDWPEQGVDGLFVAGGRSCWAILLCFQWLINLTSNLRTFWHTVEAE